MTLSQIILQKIQSDLTFSAELARILNIKQISVERAAQRASSGNGKSFSLKRPEAIKFYKDQGFTEEQIFEKTPAE